MTDKDRPAGRDNDRWPATLRLWPYARRYLGWVVVGMSGTSLSRVSEALPPLLMAWIIDRALPSATTRGDWSLLKFYALLTACAYVGEAVFDFVSTYFMESWAQRIEHDVRVAVFDRAQRLRLAYFDERQTGETMSVLSNDINQLERFLDTNLENLLYSFMEFAAVAAIMFTLDWRLTLVLMVPIPVMVIGTTRYTGMIKDKYRAIRRSVGKISARLEDVLRNIAVVKAFSQEDHERERVKELSEDYRDVNVQAIRLRSVFFPGLRVVSYAASVLVLIFGGLQVIRGSLGVGELTALLMYARRFYQPLSRFGRTVNDFQRAEASCERIFGLMDLPLVETDRPGAGPLEQVRGHVRFDDVTFQYPTAGEPSLKSVTIDVAPGEMLGVAGPTGSGKSTLVKLLLRFYDPGQGSISIDGKDIATLQLQSLRQAIGVVAQETDLFFGTVVQNIRYGKPGATMEEIERAARAAGADEFIERLPDRYETFIGEKGIKLSGGQRQRLAIARALLKNPQIIVLDEATSAVDNQTEAQIQAALDELCKGRTNIVIAHRLSTIRHADKIVVIDDGRVVERGTHDELLAAGGLYSHLWWAQLEEEEQQQGAPLAAGYEDQVAGT